MSNSTNTEIKKMVIKTEPEDCLEQDSHNVSSSNKYDRVSRHKNSLPQDSQEEYRTVSGEDCKKEVLTDDSDNDFNKDCEITENVRKIKRSHSSSNDSGTIVNLDEEFPVGRGVKSNDSLNDTVIHSHIPNFLHTDSSNVEESVDLKPSREELDIYSRTCSKLNLIQSLRGNISPLTHDSYKSDGHRFQVGADGSNKARQDDFILAAPSVPQSPVVTPTRLSRTHLRRNTTKVSPKKEDGYYNGKFLDSEIMNLITSKDGTVSFYQCVCCSKVFNKRQTLRQHYITHTDRFPCIYCSTRCKSKGDLIRHIQTHTKEKPYHCEVCGTDYTRESILKKHLQTQLHRKACYEYDKRSQLRNGGRNVTTKMKKSKSVFPCSLCSKVTYSKAEFRKHTRSHSFKYMCDICQKGCKSPLLLHIHKRSHNKTRNLSCKICSRSFANLYCLKEHLKYHRFGHSSKIHDVSTTADIIKCSDTKKMVKMRSQCQPGSKPALGKNMNCSAAAKSLECDKCHKTFSNQRRFTKHICVHDETYVCGVCTKTFSNLSKLKIHLKLHERMIKCDICESTFCDDKELEDHVQKLHADGGYFTCRLCYEHFDRKSELENHMNNHAPTMLFSGRSLDKSMQRMINESNRSASASLFDVMKRRKTDACHGNRNTSKQISKTSDKVETHKSNDSDDDSILDSQEFYDILNNALDGSDDNLNNTEVSDSDDEPYSAMKSTLENELLSSDESDRNELEDPFLLKKPLYYDHVDIMKKHGAEFEKYSEKDVENQSFMCKLCDIIFYEDKYLKNHLKHHVCEFCNTFYSDREFLAAHKSQHVKLLLKEIKTEARRLHIPKQRWKGYLMASSESENESEDDMLNEDVLKDESPQSGRFLHALPHEEIVQANKRLFEKFSCLDPENNIYACTLCARKYSRPTTLTRHLKTHVCQFCNKFFNDKSDLLEHKYNHRKKTEIVGKNNRTSSSFVSKPNRNMFKKYSFIDGDRNIFRCTLCHKDFVRRSVLTHHLKTHICNHCDKFFEVKYDLVEHVAFNHLEKQSVDSDAKTEIVGKNNRISSSSFVSKPNRNMFKKYSFIDGDRSIFRCTLCHKNFVRRSVLTRHLKTHICSHCDKFFEVKYDLVKHVAFHQLEKQSADSDTADYDDEIPENDEGEKQLSGNPLVIESTHNEIKDISLLPLPHGTLFQAQPSCSIGNEAITFIQVPGTNASETLDTNRFFIPSIGTSSFQVISKPIKLYKNVSPRPFPVASTSFEGSIVKQSMLECQSQTPSPCAEERDRPFQCGECGKRFLKNDHLKSHMTIHTGDRPFICSLCSKAFGRSTVLQKHMKTHIKQCSICEATFTQKYELHLHMQTHKTYTVYK